jgi:hypothetical protein
MVAVVNNSKDNQVWLGRMMSNTNWTEYAQNTPQGLYYYQNKTQEVCRNEVDLSIWWYTRIGEFR